MCKGSEFNKGGRSGSQLNWKSRLNRSFKGCPEILDFITKALETTEDLQMGEAHNQMDLGIKKKNRSRS